VASAPTILIRALIPSIGAKVIREPSSERIEELDLLVVLLDAPPAVAEPEPEPEPEPLLAGDVPVAEGEDPEEVT